MVVVRESLRVVICCDSVAYLVLRQLLLRSLVAV